MLKLKLMPFGKKHEHHYRLVVTEEHSKLTGRAKAVVGHYHPLSKELKIDRAQLNKWLKNGVQPTEQVRKLLKIQK